MPAERPPLSPRTILALIMGGLMLWAIYIGLGAYLYNQNPWRGVMVLVCMAAFVGFWLLLLWTAARRKEK